MLTEDDRAEVQNIVDDAVALLQSQLREIILHIRQLANHRHLLPDSPAS